MEKKYDLNVLYNEEKLYRVENVLDYHFNDISILERAFEDIEESISSPSLSSSYRLSEYGKNVIQVIIDKKLIDNSIEADICDYLGLFIELFNLDEFYYSAQSNLKFELTYKEKCSLFYALIGAVLYDSNWDFNKVLNTFNALADSNSLYSKDKEYISKIRRFMKEFTQDEYCEEYVSVTPYFCELHLNGIDRVSTGFADSIFIARCDACMDMYEYLVEEGYIIE